MEKPNSIEGKVRAVFEAYRTRDEAAFLALLHTEFRFTSPYDDAIDQAAFMKRCWPGLHDLTGHDVQTVAVTGDEAFVLYELGTKGGARFRNAERFRFRDGLVAQIDVFFGDPPVGHVAWTSDEIMTAETSIEQIYGQLNCSDLSASERWFEKLFGRPPDARPMAGLVEWYHRGAAGLQLFENSDHAGHGTLTLIVLRLRQEHGRLDAAGLDPGPLETATTTSLVRIHDPDGNLIVLAQPGEA